MKNYYVRWWHYTYIDVYSRNYLSHAVGCWPKDSANSLYYITNTVVEPDPPRCCSPGAPLPIHAFSSFLYYYQNKNIPIYNKYIE